LNLACNGLQQLADSIFVHLTNLSTLELWNNELTQLPGHLPKSLRILKLRQNSLRLWGSHRFDGFTNLTELQLASNPINNFPSDLFNPLINLRTLDLSDTGIKDLSGTMFENLTNLTHLDLSGNRIQEIPPNIFHPLTNLGSLLLHNPILELPTTYSAHSST